MCTCIREIPYFGFILARKTWFTEVTSSVVDLNVENENQGEGKRYLKFFWKDTLSHYVQIR